MIKKMMVLFLIENQCIFLTTRRALGMGGWGLENSYGVRILNPLEIIGRSLTGVHVYACCQTDPPLRMGDPG